MAVTLSGLGLKVINFFFNIYIVRQLGDDRFGQYSIVVAFASLFQIFAELGLSQYVMREIARDRSKAAVLFWNLVALRLLLAVFGVIGITLGAIAYGYSPELVLGVFIYTCTFILAAFLAPMDMLLAANEHLSYLSLGAVLGQLSFAFLGSLFLFANMGYLWLIVASLLSVLPQIGLALWALRKHNLLIFPFRLDLGLWPALIKSGVPFGIISLTLSIAFSIDTVMMSRILSEHFVGWYGVAYGLVFSINSLTSGFRMAIVPSLTRAYASDPVAVQHWYYRSVKYGLMLSLPIAVGGTLLAYPIIHLLYASEFLPAALGLQILIWDVPFLMFSSFCGNMTTIVGEERAAARIYTINALANIILNLYAIPRFGLVGAALVTVLTDLIGALQFHFLLRRKLHLPNMTSVGARVILAATVMGVAVGLAGSLNLFILISLGAVVYGLLVLALRLLDEKEWALIGRLLRKFTGAQAAKESA